MHQELWKPITDMLIPYEVREIRSLKTIYNANQYLTCNIGFKDFNISLLPKFSKEMPTDFRPEMEITLSLQGDSQVSICFDNILFMERIVGPNQEKLPEHIRVLAAEYTLEAMLNKLQKSLGCDISILYVQFNPPQDTRIDRHHLPFQLIRQEDGATFDGYVTLRIKELELLASMLQYDKVNDGGLNTEYLPIPIRFLCGKTNLLLKTIKSLEIFDIIVMDEESISIGQVTICSGGRKLWLGKIEEDKIVVEKNAEEILNNETLVKNHIGHEKSAFETDELQIELEFEIGHSTMTLKELGAVKPGYVFKDLSKLDQKTIKICANGKLIGFGDIVNIERRLGVRITEFV